MVEELHNVLLKPRTFFGTGKRKMQIEHLKDGARRNWGCPLQCMSVSFGMKIHSTLSEKRSVGFGSVLHIRIARTL